MSIPLKFRLLLWYLNNKEGTKIFNMSPEEARQSVSGISSRAEMLIEYKAILLNRIFDYQIKGRNGIIPIRIYQAGTQPNPATILFFHGGGFVLNDLDSHDKICRRIARDNEAVVIAVDYRLAPEFKFPAGVYDAYDATQWAAKHPEIHGGDPDKLIVMGDSAGGNFATVVCQIAKETAEINIRKQVLIYPCTDGRLQSPSIARLEDGYLLTKKIMQWFLDHYRSHPEDIFHPYMSPLLAEDFSNLPPAFVLTAQYDPLKDEGTKYAEQLKAGGNQVYFKEYRGMIHGFIGMPRLSRIVLDAYSDIRSFLSD